ncbi:hypothetical protein SDC9_74641 [bioreactor metagenome]|uniref:Uncharacterized protein n=1 Tax=bioreactor metagenome TaxID=1076179 RepID=A0A644YHM3_9ZZZZ
MPPGVLENPRPHPFGGAYADGVEEGNAALGTGGNVNSPRRHRDAAPSELPRDKTGPRHHVQRDRDADQAGLEVEIQILHVFVHHGYLVPFRCQLHEGEKGEGRGHAGLKVGVHGSLVHARLDEQNFHGALPAQKHIGKVGQYHRYPVDCNKEGELFDDAVGIA